MGCMAALEAEPLSGLDPARGLPVRVEVDWDKLRIFHAGFGGLHPCRPASALAVGVSLRSTRWRKSPPAVSAPRPRPHPDRRRRTALHGGARCAVAAGRRRGSGTENIHESPRGPLKIKTGHGIAPIGCCRVSEFSRNIQKSKSITADGGSRTGLVAARSGYGGADARAGAGRPDPEKTFHRALSHVRHEGVSGAPGARRHWKTCNFPIVVYFGETAAPEIREINWLLEHYKKHFKAGCKGSITRINNITGILQAVEVGLGIGVLPDYVAADTRIWSRCCRKSPPQLERPSGCSADALRQSGVAAFRLFGQGVQGLAVLAVSKARDRPAGAGFPASACPAIPPATGNIRRYTGRARFPACPGRPAGICPRRCPRKSPASFPPDPD